MNVLVLGSTSTENYLQTLLTYAEPDDDLYTFEQFFCEEMDAAADKLQMKLFTTEFFLKKGETRKMSKMIYFTQVSGLTEVMILDEAIVHKIPVIFIPV